MLFNSHVFLFAFLPVCLVLHRLALHVAGGRAAVAVLVVASLVYYGWWNPADVPILLGSAVANFLVGDRLIRLRVADRPTGPLLWAGVAGNLLLLGRFKYAAFLDGVLVDLGAGGFGIAAVALPLAISFFTFQQIAYLADAAAGRMPRQRFVDYLLFVTFFPQLIAGPIVHHSEMMPQFAATRRAGPDARLVAEGLAFFVLGLAKKVLIADPLATIADPVFAAAATGPVTAAAAWTGAVAYTLQLYFDFSGYSDMAVGLARLFGIRLPYNFASPYKATGIVEFWRRWHMTLSRFLRDYLYVPLGGSRRGPVRRWANLAATMVLGGLWHGAGWTFVAWGALHGLYLGVNHAWNALRRGATPGPFARIAAGAVTFLAVVIGWVLFRAPDIGTAGTLYAAMAGASGLVAPGDDLAPFFLAPPGEAWSPLQLIPGYAGGARIGAMGLLLALVWLAPNTQEIVDGAAAGRTVRLRWRPDVAWAAALAALTLACVTRFSEVSAFLYFNF
jgi:D-alanyl-lipoteichoic acid acyltransferase DltB (MBOAT superfamily)